jgi:hypothetical protein
LVAEGECGGRGEAREQRQATERNQRGNRFRPRCGCVVDDFVRSSEEVEIDSADLNPLPPAHADANEFMESNRERERQKHTDGRRYPSGAPGCRIEPAIDAGKHTAGYDQKSEHAT